MTTDAFIRYLEETIGYLNIKHPDYSILAARVVIYDLHKKTHDSLLDYVNELVNFEDNTKRICSLINDETYQVFVDHHQEL